ARMITSSDDLAQRKALLASRDLSVPGNEDEICGLFEDETLVATGSLVGNMLQGMAVAPGHDGEGLTAQLITQLLEIGLRRYDNLRIFTKASSAYAFIGLGFQLIMKTKAVALLEWHSGMQHAVDTLRAQTVEGQDNAGVIVMNANPFTLGHQWLAGQAAEKEQQVYVLVVEEDRSAFPFAVRFQLVKDGLAQFKNIKVIPSGPYVVSSATFPAYFTRRSDLSATHSELDASLFAKFIAPALRAKTRYLGSEPFSPTTAIYNQVLRSILPSAGINVVELQRYACGPAAVSASRVRKLLAEGNMEEALRLVPPTTAKWLTSPEALPCLEQLKVREDYHENHS
ncbi:MAG: [citrate (pro-3S)-lyase] ligase, partial [Deltaproteobacteria bacterium]|nr:[citrate (pro-3S)-lyase] ligase [Deltaproteobacteria bacterium]